MNNNCDLCGDPIQKGMEVRIRNATYHADCAVLKAQGNGLDRHGNNPCTTWEENNSSAVQQCNECGESVALGSGRFVNRVVDFNDVETRKQMGKPFPKGDYICSECSSEPKENDGQHADGSRGSAESDEGRTLDPADAYIN